MPVSCPCLLLPFGGPLSPFWITDVCPRRLHPSRWFGTFRLDRLDILASTDIVKVIVAMVDRWYRSPIGSGILFTLIRHRYGLALMIHYTFFWRHVARSRSAVRSNRRPSRYPLCRLSLEHLEDRRLLSVTGASVGSGPTAHEQYLLELINRGRANPSAEASRYNVGLNAGLPSGTISTTPKQPLAFSPSLIASARAHSQWMVNTNNFSHIGQGGSNAGDRMQAAGYQFVGAWSWAENIVWQGTTGPASSINLTQYVEDMHKDLYLSAGHRVNQMNGLYREVGVGVVQGPFTQDGRTWNAVLATEDFAVSGTSVFLTGVVFDDGQVKADQFYTPGEGLGGVTIAAINHADAQRFTTTSWASGGYSLPLPAGTYTVTASGGPLDVTLVKNSVAIGQQNVKVDFTLVDNAAPIITGLTASPSPVVQSESLSLTAHGVSDPDGHVVEVRFYRDGNGDGRWDPADELLGADQHATGGWNWSGTTAGWPVGTHTVFARARDDQGAWSEAVSTTVTVVDPPPIITDLSAYPQTVLRPGQITLSADFDSASPGAVARVDFYRDGLLLGTDDQGSDGWSWTGITEDWTTGQHHFSARAWSQHGVAGQWATADAWIVADFAPIDFGVVPRFTTRQAELTVNNDGPQPLMVDPAALDPPFAMLPVEGAGQAEYWTIEPGSSRTFIVSYSPSAAGSHEVVLPLIDDMVGRTIRYRGQAADGWQNPIDRFDVDGNGYLSAQDVLFLINAINCCGARVLPPRTAEDPGPPLFLDPNGDGELTPGDVLAVINEINRSGSIEPEGSVWASPITTDFQPKIERPHDPLAWSPRASRYAANTTDLPPFPAGESNGSVRDRAIDEAFRTLARDDRLWADRIEWDALGLQTVLSLLADE